MEYVHQFIEMFLHLDVHLNEVANRLGPWLYVLMFVVIFCETGLVITPLLPGDSLLFALGALCATEGTQLSVGLFAVLLVVAAVLGDAVNYAIGSYIGPKVFHYESSRFFNKQHLMKAHEFYERHGGKTIVIARFMPIVRTFAPFVAGVARMGYVRFWQYNCIGGLAWVLIFLFGGYWVGNVEVVKKNFHFILPGMVIVSVLPMVYEWIASRRRIAHEKQPTIGE